MLTPVMVVVVVEKEVVLHNHVKRQNSLIVTA